MSFLYTPTFDIAVHKVLKHTAEAITKDINSPVTVIKARELNFDKLGAETYVSFEALSCKPDDYLSPVFTLGDNQEVKEIEPYQVNSFSYVLRVNIICNETLQKGGSYATAIHLACIMDRIVRALAEPIMASFDQKLGDFIYENKYLPQQKFNSIDARNLDYIWNFKLEDINQYIKGGTPTGSIQEVAADFAFKILLHESFTNNPNQED